MLFECCVDCVDSAVAAQASGAGRVELCEGLVEGGTTPSIGKIRAVRKALSIPVHVLIRPRAGDFLYNEAELDIMIDDIEECKRAGIAGVVLGAMTCDGNVDNACTARLVAAARPMAVTFHRAVDVARDYAAAVQCVAKLGCDYLLTSGGASTAVLGSDNIRLAVTLCTVSRVEGTAGYGPRTVVIAGGGVTPSNASSLVSITGVTQVHGSARVPVRGSMTYRPDGVSTVYMGGERRNCPEVEYDHRRATVESVTAIMQALGSS